MGRSKSSCGTIVTVIKLPKTYTAPIVLPKRKGLPIDSDIPPILRGEPSMQSTPSTPSSPPTTLHSTITTGKPVHTRFHSPSRKRVNNILSKYIPDLISDKEATHTAPIPPPTVSYKKWGNSISSSPSFKGGTMEVIPEISDHGDDTGPVGNNPHPCMNYDKRTQYVIPERPITPFIYTTMSKVECEKPNPKTKAKPIPTPKPIPMPIPKRKAKAIPKTKTKPNTKSKTIPTVKKRSTQLVNNLHQSHINYEIDSSHSKTLTPTYKKPSYVKRRITEYIVQDLPTHRTVQISNMLPYCSISLETTPEYRIDHLDMLDKIDLFTRDGNIRVVNM